MKEIELLEAIAEALGVDLTGEGHISIVYPPSGGNASLSAGEHVINLLEGTTRLLPEGTIKPLSDTLKKGQFGRSVTIWEDQDVTFRTDTEAQSIHTINAYDFWTLEHKKFRKIFIKTTATTNFKIWVSTHPTGAPKKYSLVSASPTSLGAGQKSVTSAGTPEQLTTTSTPIKSVTIKANIGNVGDIYVVANTGFILGQGDGVSFDIDDLSKVYIDSANDGDGVSYLYVA